MLLYLGIPASGAAHMRRKNIYMKKLLVFGASNSSKSINKKLATYAASLFKNYEAEILDLNDYEMPIYKMDREVADGIPALAHDFAAKIDSADLILISLAENNGAYSTAFKNIYDWVSRIKTRKTFGDKNMILLATSPGPRGGATILEIAAARFPRDGAKVVATFSLPNFEKNFSNENKISDESINNSLIELIKKFDV